MNLSENPCKPTCPLRTPTCHANCKEYFKYREKLDAENSARKEDLAISYTISQIIKQRKRKNEKHRT